MAVFTSHDLSSETGLKSWNFTQVIVTNWVFCWRGFINQTTSIWSRVIFSREFWCRSATLIKNIPFVCLLLNLTFTYSDKGNSWPMHKMCSSQIHLIWSLITEMYVVNCWSLSSSWVNTWACSTLNFKTAILIGRCRDSEGSWVSEQSLCSLPKTKKWWCHSEYQGFSSM